MGCLFSRVSRQKQENRSLDNLSGKLDREFGEVQRKIHNLRNKFCQELKKSGETKSGQATGQTCKCRRPYFDSLKFIKGAVAARKSTGNLVCRAYRSI